MEEQRPRHSQQQKRSAGKHRETEVGKKKERKRKKKNKSVDLGETLCSVGVHVSIYFLEAVCVKCV